MILRSFQHGDERIFIKLINTTYRNLETLTVERASAVLAPPYFNPKGFFIAEDKGAAVGCVGVFDLQAEGYLEIRYLAVKDAFSNKPIVNSLIEAALGYANSRKCSMVKAVVLTVQPYVDAYRRFGFKPIRRILRIAWDPIKIPEEKHENRKVTVVGLSEDDVAEASHVFVEGLQPYWDWWVEQKGGKETLLNEFANSMRQTPWLAARVNNKIVGVAGVTPRSDKGEASFSGVAVLPSFRMSGIGSMLMNAALNKTKQLGCKRLVVHTVAYLDAFAPGAVLYVKSGGRIEAEYLHLVREFGKTA
jgi:N-acetylglutamate synthase-like GNAT family acetyltransferase